MKSRLHAGAETIPRARPSPASAHLDDHQATFIVKTKYCLQEAASSCIAGREQDRASWDPCDSLPCCSLHCFMLTQKCPCCSLGARPSRGPVDLLADGPRAQSVQSPTQRILLHNAGDISNDIPSLLGLRKHVAHRAEALGRSRWICCYIVSFNLSSLFVAQGWLGQRTLAVPPVHASAVCISWLRIRQLLHPSCVLGKATGASRPCACCVHVCRCEGEWGDVHPHRMLTRHGVPCFGLPWRPIIA